MLCALVFQLGCGGGEGEKVGVSTDEDVIAISQLVSGASDLAVQGLSQVRTIFTKDAAPNQAKVKELKESYFNIEGDVSVAGTSATIPVRVNSYANGPGALVTWKAVKEGDGWKLTDAPTK